MSETAADANYRKQDEISSAAAGADDADAEFLECRTESDAEDISRRVAEALSGSASDTVDTTVAIDDSGGEVENYQSSSIESASNLAALNTDNATGDSLPTAVSPTKDGAKSKVTPNKKKK